MVGRVGMSHFYTLVLVDPNTIIGKSREAVESKVASMIAPYDESLVVEEYDEKCYCVGLKAREQARKSAEEKFSTIDEYRTRYHAIPEKDQPDWEKFIEPYVSYEKKALSTHPLRFKANPKCEECRGKGLVKTKYNPRSKWDWYSFGGRWTGALSGYEPWKDPRNMEECDLCRGTGVRRDQVAMKHKQVTAVIGVDQCVGEEDHPRKGQTGWCNGCDGRGSRTKFRYEQHDGDIQLAGDIKEEALKKHMPYAVVTPDGEWWNQGRMGWWGMSTDNLKDEDWDAIVRDMIKTNAGCLAVVVDCHI